MIDPPLFERVPGKNLTQYFLLERTVSVKQKYRGLQKTAGSLIPLLLIS
jgi:hypothetical protein